MKIHPLHNTLIRTYKAKRMSKPAFGSGSAAFSQDINDEASFKRRQTSAVIMGFLTGIIALGLGILWFSDRVKKGRKK